MNTGKIVEIMKCRSIQIPLFLAQNYKSLKIEEKDLLLLGLLIQNNELDYSKMAKDLNVREEDVLLSINNLQEKGLIDISVSKNKEGIMEEKCNLTPLYSKLALGFMDNKEKDSSEIYKLFEQEFGRTLSSMEFEIISGWLEAGYQEEIIKEALREAVYSGASNLRYIDRILFEWNKKGIKGINDIKRDKEKHSKAKSNDIKIPDYNWLEDNE